MATLNEACKVHPNAKWWIKGDGCDVVSGLEESMQLEWHGDVDFGTGDLQSKYKSYRNRLRSIDILKNNIHSENGKIKILGFLSKEEQRVIVDLTFITSGMLCI